MYNQLWNLYSKSNWLFFIICIMPPLEHLKFLNNFAKNVKKLFIFCSIKTLIHNYKTLALWKLLSTFFLLILTRKHLQYPVQNSQLIPELMNGVIHKIEWRNLRKTSQMDCTDHVRTPYTTNERCRWYNRFELALLCLHGLHEEPNTIFIYRNLCF
jgi:hypothetical protein